MTARIVLALMLVSTAASAGQPPMSEAERATFKKYCTNDYLQYCGNLDPAGKEVDACFKANMTKLNPNCQAAIKSFDKSSRNNASAR